MDRREVLRYTALATGAAIVFPLSGSMFSGCKTDSIPDSLLSFFEPEEFQLLQQVIDTILPATDSPSATAVGVHNMIDGMIGKNYDPESKSKYRSGWNAVKSHLAGLNFSTADADGRHDILKSLYDSDGQGALQETFLELRQQTIAAYLSTEEIGKNYLNYLPVPGVYEGCIDLASVDGKAWAL